MFRIFAASAAFSLTPASLMSAELPSGSAQADIRGVLETVGKQVEASEEIQSNFKICPAEIAGASRSLWRSFFSEEPMSRRTCEADIQACYRICMDEGNASACVALGYTLEAAEPIASPLWAQCCFPRHVLQAVAAAAPTGERDFATDSLMAIRC